MFIPLQIRFKYLAFLIIFSFFSCGINTDNEKNETKVTLGNVKIKIDEPIKNSKPSSLEKSGLEKIK